MLYKQIIFLFFIFRQKPSKQLAKLIILSIWIVSLILATPFAYALRVTISKYKDGNSLRLFIVIKYLTQYIIQFENEIGL